MMTAIKRFEEIKAWQKGRELCSLVYRLTRKEAFSRDYPLRDEMRRAAISVISNVAEGFESQSNKAFIRYLYLAKGSCGEVRSQAYIALDQQYITEEEFEEIYQRAIETSRLIAGFITYLESSGR